MSWSEWMVILEKCRIPPGCALTTALDTGAQGSSASPFLKKKQTKKSLLKSIWLGADVLCLSSIEVSWSSANANDVRGEEAKILPRMSAVGLGRARRRTVAWLRCIAKQTGPGAA